VSEQKARDVDDEPDPAIVRRVTRAIRQGDLDEARRGLDTLRTTAPAAVETRGLELDLLLRSGESVDAARLADTLATQFTGSARVQYLAGLAAFRVKDYPAAIERLRESDRLFRQDRTRRQLAKALTRAGELDEAETLLLELVDADASCRVDLSWLYERRGDDARALREIETYIAHHPDDEFARSQKRRLSAAAMTDDDLLEEVETLAELGEDPPNELLPKYCAALVRTGRVAAQREFLAARAASVEPYVVVRMAWECYHLSAWDAALDLFLVAARHARYRREAKIRSAALSAARRTSREAEAGPVFGSS